MSYPQEKPAGYAYPRRRPPPPQAHGDYSDDGERPSHRLGFADRLSALGARAASPINALANKIGSEGFLPATMDKECEKAARVLKAFCKHGIYADTDAFPPTKSDRDDARGRAGGGTSRARPPTTRSRTLLTIPAKVIRGAVGLAIFTTGRVGFHLSGATGSGVLLARHPDTGAWSPPVGIQIHALGAGFVIGADIYDCVLVLNTQAALDAFRSTRLALGTDLAVVAGPYGAGASVDIAAPTAALDRRRTPPPRSPPLPTTAGNDGRRPASAGKPTSAGRPSSAGRPTSAGRPSSANRPTTSGPATTTTPTATSAAPPPRSPLRQTLDRAAYAYIKSRGVYAGVQVDGTVVTVRQTANAAFYTNNAASVSVESILRGEVAPGPWQRPVQVLLDAVYGAEGRPVSSHQQHQPPPPQPQQQQQQQQQKPYPPPSPSSPPLSPPSPYAQPGPTPQTAWANAEPAVIVPAPGIHRTGTEADVNQTYVHDQPTRPIPTGSGDSTAPHEAAYELDASGPPVSSPPPPAYEEPYAAAANTQQQPPAYREDGVYRPYRSEKPSGGPPT
ncbi:DUF500 domain containing protein [Niveomyces insectorum RCEF 264]|uniref:DUF500 domain containing protein n=1 Tax=Niveomyces insectorum RCEF 264 TaxID=1081102 RepID=A0A167QCU9_9HYPO|nr:DUF500 domain containing protein [Niveomyces insectorum RCEF 264]